MSDSSSDEFEEEINFNLQNKRPSIKLSRPKIKFAMEFEQKDTKKRISSATFNLPKNFVPKLEPRETDICPSPIMLNEKSPPKIQDVQNTTISTSSFDSRKEFKKIKIKIKLKKSIKLINEKVYPISDCEGNKNCNSDSDSSKCGGSKKNTINLMPKNNINTIKKMRLKMSKIRKKSINDSVLDDINIGKHLKKKNLLNFKKKEKSFENIYRTNKFMSLYPLNSLKYRNKSHSTRINKIPTILGFLERTKSYLSLNSLENK